MHSDGGSATEFPRDMLPLLRCSRDGAALVVTEHKPGTFGLMEARLDCTACGRRYFIRDGIARMIGEPLTGEDQHEVALRDIDYEAMPDGDFVPPTFGWRSEFSDLIQLPQHLGALEPLHDRLVLEIGCGDGRFTLLMGQLGAKVLAIDFSINALRRLSTRLASGKAPTAYQVKPRSSTSPQTRVALVHADATHLRVAPRAFDRAISTTPLDTREQRLAMYHTICTALSDSGWYAGSFEYDDLYRRTFGLPKARRYTSDGVFIEHFDKATCRGELSPYFSQIQVCPIRQVKIPFVRRLPQSWAIRLSIATGKVPLLREFGEILLFRAERPVRPPIEGARRKGNLLARRLFCWYARRNGHLPAWEGEPLDYKAV